MKEQKPKILIWDIETSHTIVATFSLWPKYIPHENILQDWSILSVAWKWYGEDKVHCKYNRRDLLDDRDLVKHMIDVVGEADLIIHHNGDKFDLPSLNTRAIKHKLGVVPPIKTLDTLKIARKKFKFISNRLDYIGQFLGEGSKTPHSSGLWLQILQGNRRAIKEMAEYNKGDVVLLERIYERFIPYTDSFNHAIFTNGCPKCGKSGGLIKRGFMYTRTSKKQRYKCENCGGWSQDGVGMDIGYETTAEIVR